MSQTDTTNGVVADSVGPSPLEGLCDREWQGLLDKDDRTSPAEYPEMALINRAELGGAMSEAYLLAKQKPDPVPEWEAMAEAAHQAIVGEVGINPLDTLAMLETWTAVAEPADYRGKITFSRSLLDSAADALRMALQVARAEYARGQELKAACAGVADDFMTSEVHHPGYVLIPTERFERIRVAAESGEAVGMIEAVALVAGERRRQVEVEGWSRDHDDAHDAGELALAAAAYAEHSARSEFGRKSFNRPGSWPLAWARSWWKPTTPLRDLVKAGALIIAEVERRLRAGERP